MSWFHSAGNPLLFVTFLSPFYFLPSTQIRGCESIQQKGDEMPWVRFSKNFNYMKPSFTIAYKEGMVMNVKQDCADEAIAKGRAKLVKTPRKGEAVEDGSQDEN